MLFSLGHHHLARGQIGHDSSIGCGARTSAEQDDMTLPHSNSRTVQRLDTFEQATNHSLERGTRQHWPRNGSTNSENCASGLGPVRRALAVEIRNKNNASRTSRRIESGAVERIAIQIEHPRKRIGDLGGV